MWFKLWPQLIDLTKDGWVGRHGKGLQRIAIVAAFEFFALGSKSKNRKRSRLFENRLFGAAGSGLFWNSWVDPQFPSKARDLGFDPLPWLVKVLPFIWSSLMSPEYNKQKNEWIIILPTMAYPQLVYNICLCLLYSIMSLCSPFTVLPALSELNDKT